MKNIQVAFIDIGERLPFNLESVAKKLNSLQQSFSFIVDEAITSYSIGNPDVEDEWYNLSELFKILRSHNRYNDYKYLIGITHVKITEDKESQGRKLRDYFSLSDLSKVSIISVNPSVTQWNSGSKSVEQYLSFLIMCELLINITGTDLSHTRTNHCVFDDCEDRTSFKQCINCGIICTMCVSKLKEMNVSKRLIKDVFHVLHWCRNNSVQSAIINTARNPLVLLVVGTVVGWFLSSFLESYYWLFLVFFTACIINVIYLYNRRIVR